MELVTQIQETLWQTHAHQEQWAQEEREIIFHSPVCVASAIRAHAGVAPVSQMTNYAIANPLPHHHQSEHLHVLGNSREA
jgi:hypothetical protein